MRAPPLRTSARHPHAATATSSDTKYGLTDRLRAAAEKANACGSLVSPHSYLPFDLVREDGPPIPASPFTQADIPDAGQSSVTTLGLRDFKACVFDAAWVRFFRPGTIVPSLGDADNSAWWDHAQRPR